MHPQKILLVDDDEINGKIFCKRLEKRGFDVSLVHSGSACLETIHKDPSYIVLLDIVMPEMDGVEVLDTLRKKYDSTVLPIIMITAKDEVEQVVECLEMGANDYITKPLSIEIAIARINTQLKMMDLHKKSLKSKQFQTIASMVATYNHEINNPLTIAMACLRKDVSSLTQDKLDQSIGALNRIAEIVRKIEEITKDPDSIEETTYVEDLKMIKLD